VETRRLLDAWLPPEDAGAAIACLATSFTFEPSFFEGDCLARFLSLDTVRGESSDLAFLIEQEERLAEVRVSVLVDRSYAAEGRSLRWDLLPVAVRGGVQHAKVSLLIWEDVLRLIVSSANLTPAGYRRQVETALTLDADADSDISGAVFTEILDALRVIVLRAAGGDDEQTPKWRALDTLDRAQSRIRELELPGKGRGRVRIAVAPSAPGVECLPRYRDVWRGGPPRYATILSPFFDTTEDENRATLHLSEQLARRGMCDATIVVPVDYVGGRAIVRAPRSIAKHATSRFRISFHEFQQPDEKEMRRLHAKVALLESDEWIAALVGSSNFTAAGFGLMAGAGNLELNVLIGAPASSAEGRALRRLVPIGDRLDPEQDDWEPEPDEDEPKHPVLPLGFDECLLDPKEPARLLLRLLQKELPPDWEILLPQPWGRVLLDSRDWQRGKRPAETWLELLPDEHPLFLTVSWGTSGDSKTRDWPLNVTDPSALPAPEELRDLPLEALVAALGSMRPLHEALTEAIEKGIPPERPGDGDALKRHANTGQLFQRTKRMSAALEGLRRRLERPAATLDVVEWRLNGPFGPRALADSLISDARKRRALEGEVSFFVGELALTLARVDWSATAKFLAVDDVLALVRLVLKDLRRIAKEERTGDEQLAKYVERALRAARI
jgi:hypothetical protein